MSRFQLNRHSLLRLAGVGWVALVLGVGPSTTSAAEPAPGPAAWLFDPGAVVEIDMTLPPASIEILEDKPEDEYQPATFSLATVDGETYGPLEIGVRLKGGLGSFRSLSEKAAFKLKFDQFVDDQTFFGLEKLTLNNMAQDPSMVHETLAYEAFRSVAVPAPRTGYAFVRVNGAPYGLYLNVEALGSIALPRWFASTLHLYEGAYGVDVTPGSAPAFEVDEGKSKKREDLEALIVAAGDTEGDWSDGMTGVADLDEMVRMWAVERYIGHWDGYSGLLRSLGPNNYYLHSDDEGEFQMLPWGTDQTWGDRSEFDEESAGLLFEGCRADASCAAVYRDALRAVGLAIGGLDLDSRIRELTGLLAPWQELEVEPRREHSSAEIDERVEDLLEFVADRSGELSAWLDPSPPDPPAPTLRPAAAAESAETTALDAAASAQLLRVGMSRLLGAAIATPVDLHRPGRVAQLVSARVRGGWRIVCADREIRDRAVSMTMRCGLSAAALRRLDRGSLALRVRIDVIPRDAEPQSALRSLTLPRRGSSARALLAAP